MTSKITKITNPIVGKTPKIGPLSSRQAFIVLVWFLPVGAAWVVFQFSISILAVVGLLPCLGLLVLVGDKEYKFFGQFFTPKRYQSTLPPAIAKNGLPAQAVRKQAKVGKQRINPIEAKSDLVCAGEVRVQGGKTGFYLLKNRNSYCFVFGWESQGLDADMDPTDAEQVLQKIAVATQQVTSGTTLTIIHESSSQDDYSQALLDDLITQVDTPLEKLLLYSQKKRVNELKKRHLRQNHSSRIYLTFEATTITDSDWIAKSLEWGKSMFDKATGVSEEVNLDKMRRLISQAYSNGFLRFRDILNDAGLSLSPYTAQELFALDYATLHNFDAPQVPQILVLRETGIEVEVNQCQHINAVLFEAERGRSVIPNFTQPHLYIPAKNRYEGFTQVGKIRSFSHPKGADYGQLRFLWNALQTNSVHNYRLITTIGSTNQAAQQFLISRETRNATDRMDTAAKRKDMDIVSETRGAASVEARRALAQGESVISISCGLWLSRRTPADLEADFNVFQNCLLSASLERCMELSEHLWLSSQPWTSAILLKEPFDRRTLYLSSEAPGSLQLFTPPRGDRDGVLFTTQEGNSPFYLDLFSKPSHLGIWATTRGGKSVVLADFILNFHYRKIPVVAFDFPKPGDGSSTFSDLVDQVGAYGSAAYYDTGSECSNLLEMPNLEGLDRQTERLNSILDFHKRAIRLLILGDIEDPILERNIKNLVNLSYTHFRDDPKIRARYDVAVKAGFGNDGYELMPTLEDYLHHLSTIWIADYEKLNENSLSDAEREAIGFLVSSLRGTLAGKLGRSIAQPSTIDSEVSLLVFALRGLDDNSDAAIAALSAYSALLRKAASSEACSFIIDESPILFSFPAIARIVGQLCANGLKWGCRVIISGQTPKTVLESAAGNDVRATVLQNLCGHIRRSEKVYQQFVDLGFRYDLVKKYGYKVVNRGNLSSPWIIQREGMQVEANYYPSEVSLALVANNEDEQAARDRILATASDPITGIGEFAQKYSHAVRNDLPLHTIGAD